MAQAGYCSECSANVWVGPDGSCSNGHPASSVSNVYSTPEAPEAVPAPAAAPRKSNTLWIILAVVGVLLLCGLGSCVAAGALLFNARSTSQDVFRGASSNAQEKSCFANQRTVAGAFATYGDRGYDGRDPRRLGQLGHPDVAARPFRTQERTGVPLRRHLLGLAGGRRTRDRLQCPWKRRRPVDAVAAPAKENARRPVLVDGPSARPAMRRTCYGRSILTDSITSSRAIECTTSMPSVTWPNTVYWLLRKLCSPRQM